MYALAKFQPDMPINFGSYGPNNKKIDLHSRHWENKLQAPIKIDVTYE